MAKIITAAVLLLFVTRTAHADSKVDEAKIHVQTGLELYDENNFRGALVEFRRAYALAPSFKILFNIGQVELELQNSAGAFTAFERYLREGGPAVPADRAAEVRAELARLDGRVGTLTITASVGAEVLVDDTSVGFAPLADPITVNTGPHKITVRSPSGETETRNIDIAGRQRIPLSLSRDASATLAAVPTRLAPPSPQGPGSKMPMIFAWSAAGGFAIAAGVFAFKANGDSDDLTTLRGTFPTTAAALETQRAVAARSAMFADGFAVASLLTAGAALYLTLSRSTGEKTIDKSAMQLTVGLGNFAVSGRF